MPPKKSPRPKKAKAQIRIRQYCAPAPMATPISLIVGLRNDGARYTDTRHNAGYWFLQHACARLGVTLNSEKKFGAEFARIDYHGRPLHFLAPQTYMNLSGKPVAAAVNFYKIPLPQVLIAHDDLDLSPGTVRLKRGGGLGGHNGLRDVVDCIGGNGFARVRIGIGHPGSPEQVVSYVLQKPSNTDREQIETAIEQAVQQLDNILKGDFELAMNVLHSRPDPASRD